MPSDAQPRTPPQQPQQQQPPLTPLETTFTTLLTRRRSRSLLRSLSPHPLPPTADFSSNDYLSLSTHPEIHSTFLDLLTPNRKNQAQPNQQQQQQQPLLPRLGSTGSRLLDGNAHPLATSLERTIAAHHGAPAGLLFNSGFDANVGIFASLSQAGDVVVYDELVHASVHDGMRLSRVPAARRFAFAHCDVGALRGVLEGVVREVEGVAEGRVNVFVGVEGVYSMDGTVGPVGEMVGVVEEVLPGGNGYVVVDEAHAVGVFGGEGGRGLVCELGLEGRVFARVVTFGKALGSAGAIVLCSDITRDYLINYARTLIYTTALSYPSLASIQAVYSFLIAGKTAPLLTHLRHLISHTHTLLSALCASLSPSQKLLRLNPLCSNPSPIIPVFTPSPRSLAAHCQRAGYMVRAIVAPTVPAGSERVRVCLHAGNTVEEVEGLVGAMRAWVEREEVARSSSQREREVVAAGAGGSGVVEKARL